MFASHVPREPLAQVVRVDDAPAAPAARTASVSEIVHTPPRTVLRRDFGRIVAVR